MGFTSTEYSNLDQAYEYFNRVLFGGELPDLLFTYQYRGKYYGYYKERTFAPRKGHRTRRVAELALNPKMFTVCSDMEIFQTIVHEMCHHWQHTFGHPTRTGYHNKEFAKKMHEVGLIPSTTGRPGGKQTGQNMADYPAPNGQFIQAAERLIASGYSVNFETPFTVFDVQVAQPPKPQAQPASILEEALSIPLESPHKPVLQAEPHPNAKVAFRCSCQETIWGKPSLDVTCNKCGTPFRPVIKGRSS